MVWKWQKHIRLCHSLLICTWMETGNCFTVPGAYMPAEKFIEEGKIALAEFSDKRTIEEWEALYAKKKNNASFVKGYIAKRNRAKLITRIFLINT